MKAATMFSGIGAPETAMPGWDWLWHAEIEPFPSAVMAARHPDSINLGDVSAPDFAERALNVGRPDVIVFGSPCQSFSVAGKRLGLDDPRGNLALVALGIINKIKPHYFVFENVPGLISSAGGNDFRVLLETINDIGYYIDGDILDAQHHGVPQRRRRVFLVCENAGRGRAKRTSSYAATALSCLIDVSLSCLAAHTRRFEHDGIVLEPRGPYSPDGVQKRMKLFGLPLKQPKGSPTCGAAWQSWLSDLDAALAKYLSAPASSASGSGTLPDWPRNSVGAESLSAAEASGCSSMSRLWSGLLDAASFAASASTTSTATSETTHRTIFTCSAVVLSICEAITRSTTLPESFYGVASSSLTALKVFIGYARQSDCSLLDRLFCGDDWHLFAQAAAPVLSELERRVGDWADPKPVLSLAASLRGDTAPRREAREGVAAFACQGTNVGEFGTLRSGNGHLTGGGPFIADTAYALRVPAKGATWRADGADNLIASTGDISHCLNAGGMGRQDYETETLIAQPVAVDLQNTALGGDISGTLDTTRPGRGGGQAVLTSAVRRLSPVECHRLQGFPDDHCAIVYRGKPATDGPQYKALGNSMAVPVVRWILSRLERCA